MPSRACGGRRARRDRFAGNAYRVHEGMTHVRPVSEILVPRPPLISVSSITYVDGNGTTQTLSAAAYKVDTDSEPGRITPAYGYCWPTTRAEINAIAITYVAGYATRAAVPASIKQAMLLLIGHWYENREAVGQVGGTVAMAVESLLWSQRAQVL
jgi:uncharacterized phiE125 gp8 family phage protein